MAQETQATHLLNVGDKIVLHYYKQKSILTIDRVTNTQAMTGNTKFKRDVADKDFFKELGADSWSQGYYKIATPEMIEEVENSMRLQKVKAEIETKIKTATIEQAVKILEILNNTDAE